MTTKSEDRQAILDRIADDWSPNNMRELAGSLTRLADALDQRWSGDTAENRSIFAWPNTHRRIERNALNLAGKAKLIYEKRKMRRKFMPNELLAEPAWDMLLELFMQFAGQAKVSTTSLALASHVPVTTALRYIDMLEQHGMVEKSRSQMDGRVTLISLTKAGVAAVGGFLEKY